MKIRNVCFGTLLLLAPIGISTEPRTVVRFPSKHPWMLV